MKQTVKNIDTMLRESNLIEGVEDQRSMTDARKAWSFINRFDKLNASIIRETHKILMINQDIDHYDKGNWRKTPVQIGYEMKIQPYSVIDYEIKALVQKMNDMTLDPLILHIEFEKIHPFIDGNGRIGRILMNWQSVRIDNSLIVFYNDNKQDYYRIFG